jgi:hypothetical protein
MKTDKIEIYLSIYRRSIIVVFGWDLQKIINLAHKKNIKTAKFSERMKDEFYGAGLCCKFGDHNTDILIWIKDFPDRASKYGILYHELYHAVDVIAEDIDPEFKLYCEDGVSEARAYLYEYIVTECNKVLWAVKTKNKKKK